MRHLSDELIQVFLDSSGLENSDFVEEHIVVCSSCKDKLEKYRELYTHLALEPKMELGPNFNANVLKQINAEAVTKSVSKIAISIAAVLSAVIVLIVLDQLQVISMANIYQAVSANILSWLVPTTESLAHLIAKLNGNLAILGFAALAAMLFNLFDKMLIQSRHKGF